ncbi:MAG: ice-binding family protein [Bacteroidota bacterium]
MKKQITKYYLALLSVTVLLAMTINGCKKDDYEGEVSGLCPVVVATDPLDKAVDVALNKLISVTFNTEMDSTSINSQTFIINQGTTKVAGTWATTPNPKIFTFKPTLPLTPFAVYTGTVTTGATDRFKTAMVANYTWTFTAIPQITLTALPVAGGTVTGAGTFAQGSSATVAATAAAGYTFTSWTENGSVVSNSSSYQFTMAGNRVLVANFTPVPIGSFAVNLSAAPVAGGATTGTGSYTAGSNVAITATANAGYAFVNWTDGATVISISPSYQFIITGNRTLVANFRVVPASQFVVALSSNPIAGGTTNGGGSFASGTSVTITAAPNTGYTFSSWTDKATGLVISNSASYTFPLLANRTFVANFLLIPVVAIGPGPINLGAAGAFVILTKAGITNIGSTSITGNIGVSPAAATSMTGFGLIMDSGGQSSHTPIVTGGVYAADYAAPTPGNLTTAVSDMETAFTTANNLVTPAPIVNIYAGDISGRILPPGLYKWSTSVSVSSVGVTLAGGANDTWVFQIAQDLIVSTNAKITLTGGAQAKNVFWIVSGQANLLTSADFSGNILSKTLISLGTGAKVTGRLLAQTSVTMDANVVVTP